MNILQHILLVVYGQTQIVHKKAGAGVGGAGADTSSGSPGVLGDVGVKTAVGGTKGGVGGEILQR